MVAKEELHPLELSGLHQHYSRDQQRTDREQDSIVVSTKTTCGGLGIYVVLHE